MEDMEFYDMKWNVKKKFNDFELTKEKNDIKCNAKKKSNSSPRRRGVRPQISLMKAIDPRVIAFTWFQHNNYMS